VAVYAFGLVHNIHWLWLYCSSVGVGSIDVPFNAKFCRATLCISADYVVARCLSVCPFFYARGFCRNE